MNKEKQKYYARRISQANRTELLVIVYELILEEMDEALLCFDRQDFNGSHHSLQQVQKYLSQLMGTLNHNYGISGNLLSLYLYVQKLVVACDIKRNPETLPEARSIIERLSSAYREIIPQDNGSAVMENTQTVYAGLTYGKRTLNELSIDASGANRGFLA